MDGYGLEPWAAHQLIGAVGFALAVNSGGLLKKQTVAKMFTAQNTRDGKPTIYGMGWFNLKPAVASRLKLL